MGDESSRDGVQEGETALVGLGGGRVGRSHGEEETRSERCEHEGEEAQAGNELLLLI